MQKNCDFRPQRAFSLLKTSMKTIILTLGIIWSTIRHGFSDLTAFLMGRCISALEVENFESLEMT